VLNKHHRNYFGSINRIAFGVGDGAVRIWNLSKSTSLEITSLQQKNKAKIMAVSIFYICQFMHMYHIGRMTDCVQQLIDTWLLLQSPPFMKLGCLLVCSQESTTRYCLEPDKSSQQSTSSFCKLL
jgi:hypothetical protein